MKKTSYTKLLVTLIVIGIQTNLFAQWTQLNSGTTEDLNGVFFLTENIGYVVGNNGTVLRTYDHGDSWLPLNAGVSNDLNGILFSDGKIGFIIGDSGLLLRTYDGGNDWALYTTGTTDNLNNIQFPKNDSTNQPKVTGNTVLVIPDSSGNWSSLQIISDSTDTIRSLCFLDRDIGFVVGSNQSLYKTEDGGSSWIYMGGQVTGDLYDIDFSSFQNGFIVGTDDLFYSVDSGINWNGSNMNLSRTLKAVDFLDNLHGLAAGNGIILPTKDGGNNWSIDTTTTTESLNDIYYSNNGAFIVGNNGLILRNDNLPVGISDINNKKHLQIYPNPTTGRFTLEIDLKENTELSIKLYHFTGQLIHSEDIGNVTGNYTQQMDLGRYAKGIYYVQIITDTGVITKKVIYQ